MPGKTRPPATTMIAPRATVRTRECARRWWRRRTDGFTKITILTHVGHVSPSRSGLWPVHRHAHEGQMGVRRKLGLSVVRGRVAAQELATCCPPRIGHGVQPPECGRPRLSGAFRSFWDCLLTSTVPSRVVENTSYRIIGNWPCRGMRTRRQKGVHHWRSVLGKWASADEIGPGYTGLIARLPRFGSGQLSGAESGSHSYMLKRPASTYWGRSFSTPRGARTTCCPEQGPTVASGRQS